MSRRKIEWLHITCFKYISKSIVSQIFYHQITHIEILMRKECEY